MSDPNANKVTTKRQIRRRPIQALDLRSFGVAINAQSRAGPGPFSATLDLPVVQTFRIQEILQDVLRCRSYIGIVNPDGSEFRETGTFDIYVAKPQSLRGTTTQFLNATYTGYNSTFTERTSVISGLADEVQVVTPPYATISDVGNGGILDIFAIRTGNTGVQNPDAPMGITEFVEWLDLNTAGRAWAEKRA